MQRMHRKAKPISTATAIGRPAQRQRLKCIVYPAQILNPGKVFPKLHRCAELGRVHVHKGEHRFPELPRF